MVDTFFPMPDSVERSNNKSVQTGRTTNRTFGVPACSQGPIRNVRFLPIQPPKLFSAPAPARRPGSL